MNPLGIPHMNWSLVRSLIQCKFAEGVPTVIKEDLELDGVVFEDEYAH